MNNWVNHKTANVCQHHKRYRSPIHKEFYANSSFVFSFDYKKAMEQSLGYAIERRTSNILGAGKGVFVSRGKVSAGSIVALYPGKSIDTLAAILFH